MNTLSERIKKAVRYEDVGEIGKLVHLMRFRFGMAHQDVFDRFREAVPSLELSEFEDLMQLE